MHIWPVLAKTGIQFKRHLTVQYILQNHVTEIRRSRTTPMPSGAGCSSFVFAPAEAEGSNQSITAKFYLRWCDARYKFEFLHQIPTHRTGKYVHVYSIYYNEISNRQAYTDTSNAIVLTAASKFYCHRGRGFDAQYYSQYFFSQLINSCSSLSPQIFSN